ncbi:MAG: protein-glutamate O-methyltransferase CheR [Nitrospirae bacterium]|nr:protein-glutamate O-methyltransferase CheR [Nitrospirota bacterium]
MAEPALSGDHLDLILEKMYAVKGWDFRRYRKSSIMRCVERRLALSRLPSRDYIERLDHQPLEFNTLFHHITIKGSGFFRDPEVFNHIEGEVLPVTFERLRSQNRNMLRIWSAGCARGEEAYSMAILLLRLMKGRFPLSHEMLMNLRLTKGYENSACHPEPKAKGLMPRVNQILRCAQNDSKVAGVFSGEKFTAKIFATDIDEAAIDLARKGIYLKESLINVSPFSRGQFFRPAETGYQVTSSVRNLVTFGVHNMVSDIHLSHMDILLCRNLLIYFEKDLQEKVFEKFCYSLNKGGFMILGKSEVVPPLFRERFREIARKEKVYQKI